MNPLLSAALSSILRAVLMVLAGWFVRKGIWTDANATEYVSAAVVALLALGWSLWTRRAELIAKMTALAMPHGSTPADLHDVLKAGITADPNTPSDLAPRLTTPPSQAV